MNFCYCYLFIFPLWITLMGAIIFLRYRSPTYLSAKSSIIQMIYENKSDSAKSEFQAFSKFVGHRHSLARMIQHQLSKEKGAKFANMVFNFLYRDKEFRP